MGVFCHEFFRYLNADSILSIANAEKGQEIWTDRQVTATRPPTGKQIESYFARFEPDVVMFLETPFSTNLFPVARRHGCKTVGIPMHETISAGRLGPADMLICTCDEAHRKAKHDNARLMFLPIGLELFPYRNRTGHEFVCNIGYAGVHDRRQSGAVLRAFMGLEEPDARLILRCQQRWPEGWPKVDDERVTLINHSYPTPTDIYREGDISILPIAYGGYERSILESMASGMPCLTMDADPMNLYQHDSQFLLMPQRIYKLSQKWVTNTYYNEVGVEDLREKMRWLLTMDTATYSANARRQAEAQSWECREIDYRSLWLNTLEDLVAGRA